jgi:hypothetical protein
LCAVEVCNPCHIVPVEIYNPPGFCEKVTQHQVPICADVTPGENYTQTEHVGKVKRLARGHHHKSFTRVVTGGDRYGRCLLVSRKYLRSLFCILAVF